MNLNSPIFKLERIRGIKETFPNRFTQENYLKQLCENELNHLMDAMDIEEAFESNKIDLELRLLKHEHNDLKYGLKFIS